MKILTAQKYKLLGISLFAVCVFWGGHRAYASTNISAASADHWAWNDLVGWIDFYTTNTITVNSQQLTGYASSSAWDISLDCATTRSGNVCGSSNYKVTNDGSGNLSGWAWNAAYGWISFDCHNNNGCGQSSYEVLINPGDGSFTGYAWNDVIGWISFNCGNYGGCGASSYRVVTSWTTAAATGFLDSSTYDTGVSGGVQLNSVLWHGILPAGASAQFQFAGSNSPSGPWTYVGSDGTSNTYYVAAPDVSMPLGFTFHNNFRYFRYRVTLVSNLGQTASPRVDDVIVNWSR